MDCSGWWKKSGRSRTHYLGFACSCGVVCQQRHFLLQPPWPKNHCDTKWERDCGYTDHSSCHIDLPETCLLSIFHISWKKSKSRARSGRSCLNLSSTHLKMKIVHLLILMSFWNFYDLNFFIEQKLINLEECWLKVNDDHHVWSSW